MEILVTILVFFSIPIFIIFSSIFRTRKAATKLPPGPRKLPLIGNIHNLAGAGVPHRALHQLSLKHGPVMHLQLGEVPVVVISSPDAAKQVLKTHDLNLASRPPVIVAEIISYGCASIQFSPYGDYWRQLRKICTLELLSAKRVQSFRSMREEIFSDLAKSVASGEGSPMNLTEKLFSSLNAFTLRAALGDKANGKEALLPIIEEVTELAVGFDIAELFPSIKLVQMMSGMRRRLKTLHKEMDRILEGIIREHRVNDDDGSKNQQEDLVDVLLKFQDEGPLTTDNIKAVIFADIIGAGSETSATTVDWAMVEMLKNPTTMEKAQDEVRRVYDDMGHVDESRIHELDYLKSVIKETLRLHPPLPLLLPRINSQKCEIGGYDIPAGTKTIVNAWAINRDPEYWKNGECFEPERFLGNALLDYRGNQFEYIPFGAGRRICPGMAFGMANVELPLALLLYHFDWNLCTGEESEEIDMSEGVGAAVRRKKDLRVVPVVRRPLFASPTMM